MSSASRIVTLLLKVSNFVLLLISLIVLSTNIATTTVAATATASANVYIKEPTFKIRFYDILANGYMLATNVIGFTYTLLQIAFSLFHIMMGNCLISGDGGAQLDFYGVKVVSYLLATGAAAGFGVKVELKPIFSELVLVFETATFGVSGLVIELVIDKSFYEKAFVSAILLFLAFVCTAILSVISSHALTKKV